LFDSDDESDSIPAISTNNLLSQKMPVLEERLNDKVTSIDVTEPAEEIH
jgi:hypothetical protein